jgi:hypothetical protein
VPGSGTNAGARGALLLGVAVILGIILLQQFDNDLGTGAGTVSATSVPSVANTTTTRRVGLTTVAPVTTTTAKTRPKTEYKVLVANGAGVQGIAAATTNALKNVGYTTITPASATATIDKTSIQFADGYEAEARELAATLNQPATAVARLSSPPVAAADLDDAKVVVILGVDVSTTTTGPAGATTTTTRRG